MKKRKFIISLPKVWNQKDKYKAESKKIRNYSKQRRKETSNKNKEIDNDKAEGFMKMMN